MRLGISVLILAAMLLTASSCDKRAASDRRSGGGGATTSLRIELPGSDVWTTAEPTILIAGRCDARVQSLTTNIGTIADGDCADEAFNLAPLVLTAITTPVIITGLDAYGSEISDTLVVTWSNAPAGALMTITSPDSSSVATSDATLTIAGACRADVTAIASSREAAVDLDCAANGRFKATSVVTKDGSYDWALTATTGSQELAVSRRFIVDRKAPKLAITSPSGDYFGPGTNLVISGTCDQTVAKLQADVPLADRDCADGTWRSEPLQLTWSRRSVKVTGSDAAGNVLQASRKLTKTIMLGGDNLDSSGQLFSIDSGIWTDGTRLAIGDWANHRVLLYHTFPTAPDQAPDVILGQPDLSHVVVNYGGVSARSLNEPRTPYFDGVKFYVPDKGNGRVLIWNTWPTTTRQPADVVVGATRFDDSQAISQKPLSATTFDEPVRVLVHGGALWVVDSAAHRVLKFNAVPTTQGAAADLVLGQPDFSTGIANIGGLSGGSLDFPGAIAIAGTKLILSDRNNLRVLIWNTLPTINMQSADVVLGQADLTSNTSESVTARSFSKPVSLATDGTRLAVADMYNHRVLVWNTIPTVDHAAADMVLGQSDSVSSAPNAGGISASTLFEPANIVFGGGKLWVKDNRNERFLGFAVGSLVTGMAADTVWGVSGFSDARNVDAGAIELNQPEGVFIHAGRYYVADKDNNRVLIFDKVPQTPGDLPVVVLGQPDAFQSTANNSYDPVSPLALNLPAPSARNMNAPSGVMTDGTRLYVADTGNHRVLIWNTLPTADYMPANVVVGQPDMTSNTPDNPLLADQSLRLEAPSAVYAVTGDGSPGTTKLLVADTSNNRVLIWSTLPTSNGEAASLAMGQSTLTGFAASSAGANRMRAPAGVWTNGTKVAVADTGNHRVLLFDTFPTGNDATATTVVGQLAATTGVANQFGRSATSLNLPGAVASDGTTLLVADTNNHRVLVYDTWPSGVQPVADRMLGQRSFDSAAGTIEGGLPDSRLTSPKGVAFDGTSVIASSTGRDLVHLYHAIPAAHGAPADAQWAGVDRSSLRSRGLFGYANTLLRVGNRLFVSDWGKNAVYVWNDMPAAHDTPPDFILGQVNANDFAPNAGGVTARGTFSKPHGIATDGTRFAVADINNHRVLLYDSMPTNASALPDRVLGQPDFISALPNRSGVGANTLKQPRAVAFAGDRLIVADAGNNRVLVWNSWPTANQQPADVVIGQPNMQANVASNGGLSARSLGVVSAIASDGEALALVENFSSRVLLWNDVPMTNFAAADVVLGQPNFYASDIKAELGPTAQTMSDPRGVSLVNGKLAVADLTYHNRILIWDKLPTTSFAPADRVWGQKDLTSTDATYGPDKCPGGWSHFMDSEVMMLICRDRTAVLTVPAP